MDVIIWSVFLKGSSLGYHHPHIDNILGKGIIRSGKAVFYPLGIAGQALEPESSAVCLHIHAFHLGSYHLFKILFSIK